MSSPWILVDVVSLILTVFLLSRLINTRSKGPLPPGPRGWPIIGNVFDMPSEHQWETYTKWGERWGGIISVTLLGQRLVILNSLQLALDMLDKKSTIYSDRPTLVVAGELVGWNRSLVLFPYGPKLQHQRRILRELFGNRIAVEKFGSHIEAHVGNFLMQLLHPHENLIHHIQRTFGASSLHLTYGYKPKGKNDEILTIVEDVARHFGYATSPGAFLVEVLPWLKYVPQWIPGSGWKKKIAEWAKTFDDMSDIPYNYVKHQMAAGIAQPCILTKLLESPLDRAEEMAIKDIAATVYIGGAETTASAICAFFWAMACYPEIQAKAQLEIDTVIGHGQIPTFADSARLPYVHALYLEVLRWGASAPLGTPHQLKEDDISAGYLIPKGSSVVVNVWSIFQDPNMYKQPREFCPERFLSLHGQQSELDPRGVIFGFGRRVCPGIHLAEATLLHYITATLSVFNISSAKMDNGTIHPIHRFDSGAVRFPLPFKHMIRPRSPAHEALIYAIHDTIV